MKVLILEDNDIIAELLCSVFKEIDINDIDICYNYNDAITKLNVEYNLIILDYLLTGNKTGADYSAIYKKNHPNCEVIIYSAYADKLDLPNATLIQKPVRIDELITIIKQKLALNEIKNKSNNIISVSKDTNSKDNNQDLTVIFNIIKQHESDISCIKEIVTRHDEKISNDINNIKDLKDGFNKFAGKVDKVLVDNEIAKTDIMKTINKIIIWIFGLIVALMTVAVTIVLKCG